MTTLNQLTRDQAKALHSRLVARYNDRIMTDREISRLAVMCWRAFNRAYGLPHINVAL
jgi:hypothetical protein